ncbi:MAG: hypothetical protein NVSMB48_20960 [Marmoricola sp.]
MVPSAASLLAEVETLPEAWALALLDRTLSSGRRTYQDLLEAADDGSERLRWLVAIADARCSSTAESLLRCAWYAADLRTPTLSRTMRTPFGIVTASCATDYHRFAVATQGSSDQVAWLAKRRWRLLVVSERKILSASTAELSQHLRAEHLHHLATVGLDARRPGTSA